VFSAAKRQTDATLDALGIEKQNKQTKERKTNQQLERARGSVPRKTKTEQLDFVVVVVVVDGVFFAILALQELRNCNCVPCPCPCPSPVVSSEASPATCSLFPVLSVPLLLFCFVFSPASFFFQWIAMVDCWFLVLCVPVFSVPKPPRPLSDSSLRRRSSSWLRFAFFFCFASLASSRLSKEEGRTNAKEGGERRTKNGERGRR